MSGVKDRLSELQQISSEVLVDDEQDEEKVPSKNRTKKKKSPENKDLDKILDKAAEIRELIADIEANIRKAEDLEKDAQREVFRAPKIFEQINSKFRENTVKAHRAAKKLKELSTEVKPIENEKSAEARMKQVQFVTLKQQLKEVILNNSTELEKFRNIQLDNLKSEFQIANNTYTDDDLEMLLTDNNNPFQVFTDNLLVDSADARRQLVDLEERHKQFLEVEESLKEVRDLFQNIGVLVETQQESLNRVEYHAGTTTAYIGAVDLSKVRRKRRKYLKRKLCLIVTVIIVIIVVILLIVIG